MKTLIITLLIMEPRQKVFWAVYAGVSCDCGSRKINPKSGGDEEEAAHKAEEVVRGPKCKTKQQKAIKQVSYRAKRERGREAERALMNIRGYFIFVC